MNFFQQEIELIRPNPVLYLGRTSLSALYDYMIGFTSALDRLGQNDKVERLIPLHFSFFRDYVAIYYNWSNSTSGWHSIILHENDYDEKKSLETFYELYDSFMSLSIRHCQITSLNEESLNYHNTNERVPKKSLPPDYPKIEPLYINPTEIYLIELSDSVGFIFMVNTDLQHELCRNIYKSKNAVKVFIKQCFGSSLKWENINMDNYEFSMKLNIFAMK